MRPNLFWQLGITFLALTLAVLLATDLYAVRVLRRNDLRDGFERLEALGRLAQSRPPELSPQNDPTELRAWVEWMAQSGARVTLVAADGQVLADSAEDPNRMENRANRPEIREAFSSGAGRSVRHNPTLGGDLVSLALRHQPAARPAVVISLALPVKQIDEAWVQFRRPLWTAFLIMLLLGGGISLWIFRSFSARVERLKAFSRQLAAGDFHPLPVRQRGDELDALARSLNEAVGRLQETIRSLTDERNRSAAILSSMVDGVAVINAEERILFSNHALSQILGADAAGVNQPLAALTHHADLLSVVRKVLAERETVQSEVVMGTVRPRSFVLTAAPVRADNTTGAVLVLHDISELRRLERVRRDFVANVSHEFKTPLTAIQGFAETLLAGALDDPQNRRRFLEIIAEHARRLARVTDDLLKLSQIEADRMELEFRPVQISELIAGCVETSLFRARQKQLSIVVECPADLPRVQGDRNRLAEVLQNLLDNAVQYTPPNGRVTIRARAADREVIVTVADTGIGVPQADHERIFERFYRLDAARSREAGGTGLGLSIAKHIVESHSGRIWVESTVGQGSEFHFSVPTAG